MDSVLGALGVLKGTPEQTRLVTPYADGIKAFSAFLNTAKTKMRTMIYGATLGVFFDDLISAKKRGVDVKVIFDHTQSAGHAERPQIERLLQAGWKDGEDFVIGTSPQAHQIIHIKATWIDSRWVEDGSLNYSPSAFKQINTVTFSDWPEYAAYLDGIFERSWNWILEHEPQYQVKE
ncbi:phospholipase D-like domain-containing protein [Alicyclobacillus tolerans]|uniref:phospholipase D-like domain-containing protein n=1 Tax=Alicyclobacillus tolerans TaxID=90970 RepID=UPI001F3345F1|nr:phospholipase D-like domain-containing protein [Alicyclobacillus tolerans]MCF8566929.1 phospholipase D-like domain-containing protein [Alicyclobacillus tolerans]